MSEEKINRSVNNLEESTTEDTTTSEVTYSEAEHRAMELGWKPKEQWVEDGNDESDHRSAKDFLDRGEMIGKLRSQDRELQQQRLALQKLAERNQKIYESGYQAALDKLNQEKKQAAKEGDIERVEEIRDEIRVTEKRMEAAERDNKLPVAQQVDPQFETWVTQNPWYNDPVMRKFGDSLAAEYIQQNNGQVAPAQVRDFVASIVRKEFAHRFQDGKKRTVAAPNPDGQGRQSGKDKGDNSQLSKIKADLSDEERSIMKTLIKATGMKEEEYLRQYANPTFSSKT